LVLAVWNYVSPEQTGLPKTVTLRFKNVKPKRALVSLLDRDHGDFHSAYEKMGSPRYPTQVQIQDLRRAVELPGLENGKLKGNELSLTIPAHGLALIELK
jgi:xylan 1,4-beta-xylosidase